MRLRSAGLGHFWPKTDHRNALSLCFYAIPIAKPVPTFAGIALGLAFALTLGHLATPVHAEGAPTELAQPYQMVRTLQNIQDQIIGGDLTALDMQRFLLSEIDKRLRSADQALFDDTRNVDAALVYAMSGGNPETLDLLAQRDVEGNFDNRVTSILRRYLNGKGGTVLKPLKDVVPEYENTTIGPYLELIGANALMDKDPALALKFFDQARIESPGSIIEEAALRRALNLTYRKGDTARALPYARRYARRFMNSPYASQFADIFVSLALEHKKVLPAQEIKEVLTLVERRRQREIYLRLARRAAIDGDRALAAFASEEARHLTEKGETEPLALAMLYQNLVEVPSPGIEDVLKRLSSLGDHQLTPKDRFLRDAAEIVGEEVVNPPGDASLTQVRRDMVDKEYRDMMSDLAVDSATTASTGRNAAVAASGTKAGKPADETRQQALDDRINTVQRFVSGSRTKLRDIDALLSNEGN